MEQSVAKSHKIRKNQVKVAQNVSLSRKNGKVTPKKRKEAIKDAFR